jgi:hypothetical protein
MKQKPSSRRRRDSNKSILCLPDLEHAKARVLNSLNSLDAKRVIVTPSMSSLTGIVQSRACVYRLTFTYLVSRLTGDVK